MGALRATLGMPKKTLSAKQDINITRISVRVLKFVADREQPQWHYVFTSITAL